MNILKQKQNFYKTQLNTVQKEMKQVKKERKQKPDFLLTLLKQWISVDITTLICNEYIDYNFCWKCKSIYYKYANCLHKVLSGKKQSFQISAIDCNKFKNYDCFIQVDGAFPNSKDKFIWQYLISRLFENYYDFWVADAYDCTNTIRYNVTLVLYKMLDRDLNESIIIRLNDGDFCVYFAQLCKRKN